MSDVLTSAQRHMYMSYIQSKNIRPEVRLRQEYFKIGYRYRFNVKKLPEAPDIVLAKRGSSQRCVTRGMKKKNEAIKHEINQGTNRK